MRPSRGNTFQCNCVSFEKNKPPLFSGIEHDANPQDFVDVCDRLCMALGCSPVRAVELTSYQLTGGVA